MVNCQCGSNQVTAELVNFFEVNISGDSEFPEYVIDGDFNFTCKDCNHQWYDTMQDIELAEWQDD